MIPCCTFPLSSVSSPLGTYFTVRLLVVSCQRDLDAARRKVVSRWMPGVSFLLAGRLTMSRTHETLGPYRRGSSQRHRYPPIRFASGCMSVTGDNATNFGVRCRAGGLGYFQTSSSSFRGASGTLWASMAMLLRSPDVAMTADRWVKKRMESDWSARV